ncbi:hypothetical protein EDD18DRAFT_1120495 [Armillaria luteobubalina]|uniref:Uncharacterized protein n=1 Tax=Armillaria luteobubalina TaxID=153913 RepID=A0AA39QMK5_9AGAR|nr:hypothetical protein EDD18DRAFT_1120495 [Armillaria luteobubalina]
MDGEAKRKVTVKLYNGSNEPSTSSRFAPPTRSASPLKSQPTASPRPPLRPKAKVTSSVTPNSLVRKPKIISTVSNGFSTPSRVGSPAAIRPTPGNSTLGQPKARITAIRSNIRPLESNSTPSTPNIPYQPPSKPSSVSSGSSPHRRSASAISFTQNGSTLSLPLQTPYGSPSSDTFNDADAIRDNGAPKIKSKITRLAKPHDLLSPSPPQPTSRPANGRNRTPSMSSGLSLSSTNTSSTTPDYTLYPITTAVPAANPYRYGSVRIPSSTSNHHYQPFAPRDDSQINYSTTTFNAKVDPMTIPLPPQSPPTSAVSFSSRSSVSRTAHPPKQNGANLRGGIEALLQFGAAADDDSDGDSYDEETDLEHQAERKVRAEAKSNRKIEDLEISNRSLLAINVTLEATKHRQAKEIRDLKRKLRESRLILPPQAFKQVMDKDDTEEDEDEGEDGEDVPPEAGDETYLHVKLLLDNLLQAAKQALETKPSDFDTKSGTKVLSAEEVENWRDHESDLPGDGDVKTGVNTPSRDSASIGDETFDSEDEVEALTIPSPSSSPPPPILVTHSP